LTPDSDIRAARQRAGLTQQQLADRAGISQGYLSQIEHGAHGGRMRPGSGRQLNRPLEQRLLALLPWKGVR
jgi:transcriptional regulator with XRE-family HTH domain